MEKDKVELRRYLLAKQLTGGSIPAGHSPNYRDTLTIPTLLTPLQAI
jgi:hypothetical protein